MSEFITNVSDASFDQDVLQAEGPVLVATGLSGAARAK
jgi:thioredoxin 1